VNVLWAVSVPSLTCRVRELVPVWFAAGERVVVQFGAMPAKLMLDGGISVVLEFEVTLSEEAEHAKVESMSSIVKAMVGPISPRGIIMFSMAESVGGVFCTANPALAVAALVVVPSLRATEQTTMPPTTTAGFRPESVDEVWPFTAAPLTYQT
jgi:hypothetical protein